MTYNNKLAERVGFELSGVLSSVDCVSYRFHNATVAVDAKAAVAPCTGLHRRMRLSRTRAPVPIVRRGFVDARLLCAYHTLMASTMVRTTYALDEETIRRLDSLARQWNVSKSEALRRAIRTADANAGSPDDRLKALDELQASMRLTRTRAQTLVRELREQRRRSTARRLAKG
jgi:predicted transcriptional regulator